MTALQEQFKESYKALCVATAPDPTFSCWADGTLSVKIHPRLAIFLPLVEAGEVLHVDIPVMIELARMLGYLIWIQTGESRTHRRWLAAYCKEGEEFTATLVASYEEEEEAFLSALTHAINDYIKRKNHDQEA